MTEAIVRSMNLVGGAKKVNFLKVITEPFTKLIIQLDSKVIEAIAKKDPAGSAKPLMKQWCSSNILGQETRRHNITFPQGPVNMTIFNATVGGADNVRVNTTEGITFFWNVTENVVEKIPCRYLFRWANLPEAAVGAILLVMSLATLCVCLLLMVKTLNSLLKGQMAVIIKKIINTDLPGKLSFLTGYVAIIVGAGMTVLVQSSSIFTSTLTPLVGMGIISLDRMYPLTLGSNIGTTVTSILAAFAATGGKLESSLQISLCHLFFNISGIVLFYPIPIMRKLPITLAKKLGNTTADYRWFAVVYLIGMFFILPGAMFGLSVAGWPYLIGFGAPLALLLIICSIINVAQDKCNGCLPNFLKTWDFLPLPLRSLQPYDDIITKYCLCCKFCKRPAEDTESLKDNSERSDPPAYENIAFENDINTKEIDTKVKLEIIDTTRF